MAPRDRSNVPRPGQRGVSLMRPTLIKGRLGSGGYGDDDDNGDIQAALDSLSEYAQIFYPDEAPQPILEKSVQSAILEWLGELGAEDELRLVKCEPRRTAMLYGLPGCGKTTLAWHLASRLGVPLVSLQSQHIAAPYISEGGRNVTRVFNALEPIVNRVIVLMDEFDTLGAKRKNETGADQERTSTLNALLVRIEQYKGILLAATNMQDNIDPAMFRRFHIHINIDLPGADERFAICSMYGDPYQFEPDTIETLQDCLDGASPDTIKKLMVGLKRALILWPRQGRDCSSLDKVVRVLMETIQTPAEMTTPRLWANPAMCLAALAKAPWPPVLRKSDETENG